MSRFDDQNKILSLDPETKELMDKVVDKMEGRPADEVFEDLFNRPPLPFYTKFYYRVLRWIENVRDFPYEIKYFIQRGRRGWSNRDTWGFDHHLAKVIYEGVNHLAKTSHGYPSNLKDFDEWVSILNRIEKAYKDYYEFDEKQTDAYVKFTDNFKIKRTDEEIRAFYAEQEIEYNRIKEEMKLLLEYFGNLWD